MLARRWCAIFGLRDGQRGRFIGKIRILVGMSEGPTLKNAAAPYTPNIAEYRSMKNGFGVKRARSIRDRIFFCLVLHTVWYCTEVVCQSSVVYIRMYVPCLVADSLVKLTLPILYL